MRKLSFAFSPCPNDTFIFDAIVNGRINKEKLAVSAFVTDIENLNTMARRGRYDVTKLSCSAFPYVSEQYQLIKSGSALGRNCGPLLVMKNDFKWEDLPGLRIAIPGKYTTANLLLSMFAPNAVQKEEIVFSEIEDAVLTGKADVGLIIHESRFTYQQKGLKKMADMGELWEQYTGAPLPLGCIAIRRSLPQYVKTSVQEWIHDSVQFAFDNKEASREYIMKNAREMSEEVQQKHIALYVNEFSLDLGEQGMKALDLLFRKGAELNLLTKVIEPVFID